MDADEWHKQWEEYLAERDALIDKLDAFIDKHEDHIPPGLLGELENLVFQMGSIQIKLGRFLDAQTEKFIVELYSQNPLLALLMKKGARDGTETLFTRPVASDDG